MPTTPKPEPEAIVLARQEIARLTAQVEEQARSIDSERNAAEDARRLRIADQEAEIISRAVQALTDPHPDRIGPRRLHPDYERIFRYLAHRFGVRWPSPSGETIGLLEVHVLGNILDGTVLTIDPTTCAIVDARPPRMF